MLKRMDSNLLFCLVGLAIGLVVGLAVGAAWGWGASRVRGARSRADRDDLATQFKALSADALIEQGRRNDAEAARRARESAAILEPMQRTLEGLNQRLAEVEQGRIELGAELRQQVQAVMITGEHLRRETGALATALRRPQVRGTWGEMQLKRVAEIAGMVERCDFDLQVSIATEQGPKRPDMRVNLADGKVVFVDSKVPLTHFLDALDTDDADGREAQFRAFAGNVRDHVDQLSKKQYWRLDGGSPEMVVLFLPSEAFLQAALEQLPDLHEYAAVRNVVFATPSILIALLKTVRHGWTQSELARNADEVLTLGRELYQRLSTLGGHLAKVGSSLSKAVESFNSALGSIDARVMPTARKMGALLVADPLTAPQPLDAAPRPIITPELLEAASGGPLGEGVEEGDTMAR